MRWPEVVDLPCKVRLVTIASILSAVDIFLLSRLASRMKNAAVNNIFAFPVPQHF